MELLRARDYRRMPWKNGGGETFEIAASPPGASLDAIDWRLSMASVTTDGPFSVFPGIDRTLVILQGEGLHLEIGDEQRTVRLDRHSQPFAFAGDVPLQARLLDGPVTDLNVMSHRDRCSHRVQRLQVSGRKVIDTDAPIIALVCCSGTALCGSTQAPPALIDERDCLLFRDSPRQLVLNAAPSAVLLLAGFHPTTV